MLCYNIKSDIRFQLYFRSVNVMTTEKVEERATMNDERNKESLKLVNCGLMVYTFEGSREDVENTFKTRIRQNRNDRYSVEDNFRLIF